MTKEQGFAIATVRASLATIQQIVNDADVCDRESLLDAVCHCRGFAALALAELDKVEGEAVK